MKAERIQLEDLPVYDVKTKKVLEGGIGGRVMTSRIYTAHYNRNLIAAKRRIFDALRKEGVNLEGVKHKKRVSMFLTMFDFKRPIEIRLWDYIIELYKQGLLPDPNPKSPDRKKREPKTVHPPRPEFRKKVKQKEEIPEWRQEYLDYLKSSKWREFRLKALDYFGNECGLCASTHDLQIHHKHYKNLYNETFKDVIPLCRKCHRKHHDK